LNGDTTYMLVVSLTTIIRNVGRRPYREDGFRYKDLYMDQPPTLFVLQCSYKSVT